MLITATSYSCMTGIGIGRALQLAEFCGNDWLWIVNYIPHQCPHERHLDNDAITVHDTCIHVYYCCVAFAIQFRILHYCYVHVVVLFSQ